MFRVIQTWASLLLSWLVCQIIIWWRINTHLHTFEIIEVFNSQITSHFIRRNAQSALTYHLFIGKLPHFSVKHGSLQLYLNWSDVYWELQNGGCQTEEKTSTWKIAGRCIIEHMHGTSEQVKDFLNRSYAKVVTEDYSQRLIGLQKVKGPCVVLESFAVWATLHYIIYLHPYSIIKQTLTECAKAIWNSSFPPSVNYHKKITKVPWWQSRSLSNAFDLQLQSQVLHKTFDRDLLWADSFSNDNYCFVAALTLRTHRL